MDSYLLICRKILKSGCGFQTLYFEKEELSPIFSNLFFFDRANWKEVSYFLVYIELYKLSKLGSIELKGCTLSIGPSTVSSSAKEFRTTVNNNTKTITFKSSDKRHSLNGVINISRNKSGDFNNVDSVTYEYSMKDHLAKKVILKRKETRRIKELIKSTKVTCTKCRGKGRYYEFSIPKADWGSGLSGYALYDCNKISTHYGCHLCGGSGVEYEPWYIDENPELTYKTEQIVNGKGIILLEPPPLA